MEIREMTHVKICESERQPARPVTQKHSTRSLCRTWTIESDLKLTAWKSGSDRFCGECERLVGEGIKEEVRT
jgi:hypothetical protein